MNFKITFKYIRKGDCEIINKTEYIMLEEGELLSKEIDRLKRKHEEKALTAITTQIVKIEDKTDKIVLH